TSSRRPRRWLRERTRTSSGWSTMPRTRCSSASASTGSALRVRLGRLGRLGGLGPTRVRGGGFGGRLISCLGLCLLRRLLGGLLGRRRLTLRLGLLGGRLLGRALLLRGGLGPALTMDFGEGGVEDVRLARLDILDLEFALRA